MSFNFLKRLFTRETLPERMGYADARAALENRSLELRRALAARDDAPPETLYYLASDADAGVRGAVAANRSTPIQADEYLVNDEEGEVRMELARKIGRLAPDMSLDEVKGVRNRVLTLLERLARDELVRVRQIVAEEIKSCPTIPKRLAIALARDAEIAVCGPVLEYSPLLSDEDLLEIVATSRVQGALEAIAKRRNIDASLADAIVATLEIPAVAQLLANPRAAIRDETLDRIIAEAASIEAWHLPLVMRPGLSVRAIRRIAVFVSRALIDELCRSRPLDEETKGYLKARAQVRIIDQDKAGAIATPDTAIETIKEAFAQGRLDDEAVTRAASLQHKSAVVLALALKTGAPEADVSRIIDAKSGKGIAALCWQAGLAMRTALAIEIFVANVPADARVLPRGGVDYPMNETEMRWHLNYFGIAAAE